MSWTSGPYVTSQTRLPTWMVSVRRYSQVQQALDLIETTAMLDPRNLQDSQGRRLEQASPLAGPTDGAEPITSLAD